MIRPLTLITMMLAAGSGAYLFAVKHRAQVLDDQLAASAQASRLDAQRLRVLQAQWALEIDPSRLSQLAGQFTTLKPMQPAQLVTLASLRTSLPAAGSPPPSVNPLAPTVVVTAPALTSSSLPATADTGPIALAAPAQSALTAATAATDSTAATVLPLPPAPAPAAVVAPDRLASAIMPSPVSTPDAGIVSAEAVLRHLSDHQSAPADHSSLHVASTRAAENLPPPRPLYAENASGPAITRSVPIGAAVMSVKAVSPTPPVSVSALGMAANLAPPQPLSGGNSN